MLSLLVILFLNSFVHSIAIYESDLKAIPFRIEHKEIAIAKSIDSGVENSGNQAVAFLPATEFATTLNAVIQIGVPAQPVKVLFDTGSSLFWVMASHCQTESCLVKAQKYNHSSSLAYKPQPLSKRSSEQYGDGSSIQCLVSGSDRISLGSVTIENQPICEAFSVNGINHAQGFVGIGPPKFIGFKNADLMVGLVKQKSLKENVLGFWFNTADSAQIAGELQFGGIDSSKLIGNVTYYNITSQRDYWRLSLDKIVSDNHMIPFPNNFSKSIVIDSGTTYALLPAELAEAINSYTGMTVMEQGLYTIDCTRALSIPPLKFYFAGNTNPLIFEGRQMVRYVSGGTIHKSICVSIFQKSNVKLKNQTVSIFGALFMRNFLTVFNYDNESIGFGRVAGPPSNSPFSSALTVISPIYASILESCGIGAVYFVQDQSIKYEMGRLK